MGELTELRKGVLLAGAFALLHPGQHAESFSLAAVELACSAVRRWWRSLERRG